MKSNKHMEKSGSNVNGVVPAEQAPTAELAKELSQLRARLAEIASMLRRSYGRESVEAKLTEDVSASVQRLEAQVLGCPSAKFE